MEKKKNKFLNFIHILNQECDNLINKIINMLFKNFYLSTLIYIKIFISDNTNLQNEKMLHKHLKDC